VSTTLYWHDYETFGRNPRWAGIAQFAGIRTDEELNEIGEPLMMYSQPPQDSWPEPDACLITGITPQHCRKHGLPDYRFAKAIVGELGKPGTCGVGFNNIRFDDEFTRQLLYRNFYDPYEREWKAGNSRWDLLDVLRMARALRPEGVVWPVDAEGSPTMKLERLTAANNIAHIGAHDALVDVRATIAMARLLKKAQPRLYDFAFRLRQKKFAAEQLDLQTHKPLLHTSGKLGGKRFFTSLVMPLMKHPVNNNGVVIVDLMQDPTALMELSPAEIRARIFTASKDLEEGIERLSLKTVHLNKSPMLAPISLLNADVESRIGLDRVLCEKHWQKLLTCLPQIQQKLADVFNQPYEAPVRDAEFLIYDGFVSEQDKREQQAVRRASPQELSTRSFVFTDRRLPELLFRYRARNFPESLSPEELAHWQEFRHARLHTQISPDWLTQEAFLARIAELELIHAADPEKLAVLAALQAWEAEIQ
jgi:exodeoxyribonuclease-1